jgi:hypothetical protein
MPIKIIEKDKIVADFDGSGDIVAQVVSRKENDDWALSLRNCPEGNLGRTLTDEEKKAIKDSPEVIFNFSNAKSVGTIRYLLEHIGNVLEGVNAKLSRHIGKTKDGDLIRVFKTVGGYQIDVDGEPSDLYDDFVTAERDAKKEMIWSYLPQLDESEVEGLIDSSLEIKYKWEWMR